MFHVPRNLVLTDCIKENKHIYRFCCTVFCFNYDRKPHKPFWTHVCIYRERERENPGRESPIGETIPVHDEWVRRQFELNITKTR